MNLNDQPYAYGNENWKSIQPKIIVPTKTLAHSFCHNEVKYFDYVHQSEPTTTLLDFMNVLADIVSTFNNHSAENFTPSHVPRTNKILSTFPEWINKNMKIFSSGRRHHHRGHYITRLRATCGYCSLLKHLYYIFCTTRETDAQCLERQ